MEKHLQAAERLWQQGKRKEALELYDKALEHVRAEGDKSKEGMICLGKGFALLNVGEFKDAIPCLECAREIAISQGEAAQAQFMETLVAKATASMQQQQEQQEEQQQQEQLEKQHGKEQEAQLELEELKPQEQDDSMQRLAENAVKAAFADSLVRRAPMVLAMKGTPAR